jgi:hypothetical protein
LDIEPLVREPRVAALPAGHELTDRDVLTCVRDDVVYRPMHDASPYTIAIAWPAGARSRWIAQFVRTAIELTEHSEGTHALAEIA